ncbi:response regulator [Ectothiorhodospiraceae bacterium WFHF3C12]|nr:response regulator [Ectothiorhodospiraceae bacterium WFHF3C12]
MTMPILVVDDSTMSRKLLLKALPEDWDVSVTQASGGEAALDVLRQGGVDVMFLDLTMPGVDGFEVLRRKGEEGLDCITIVVSADIQERAVEQALELGAQAFVKKPVEADRIRQALEELGLV